MVLTTVSIRVESLVLKIIVKLFVIEVHHYMVLQKQLECIAYMQTHKL